MTIRLVLPFPVLPGKDAREISDDFSRRPDEYAESRRRLRNTMERVYLQTTPMGDFVVAYTEGELSFEEETAALVASDLDIDKFFIQKIHEIHGIDLTQPQPPGPPPENVGEWVDSAVSERRRGMAFCAPLLPNTRDAGRAFAREAIITRADEFTASRRALDGNQTVEVITVVATPQGDVCAIYLEGNDPFAGNATFAASTSPFDVRFKDELKKIFPPFVDFNVPVAGVTEIFDSQKLLARA